MSIFPTKNSDIIFIGLCSIAFTSVFITVRDTYIGPLGMYYTYTEGRTVSFWFKLATGISVNSQFASLSVVIGDG